MSLIGQNKHGIHRYLLTVSVKICLFLYVYLKTSTLYKNYHKFNIALLSISFYFNILCLKYKISIHFLAFSNSLFELFAFSCFRLSIKHDKFLYCSTSFVTSEIYMKTRSIDVRRILLKGNNNKNIYCLIWKELQNNISKSITEISYLPYFLTYFA